VHKGIAHISKGDETWLSRAPTPLIRALLSAVAARRRVLLCFEKRNGASLYCFYYTHIRAIIGAVSAVCFCATRVCAHATLAHDGGGKMACHI
jgi:hypothetical protein